MLPSSNAKLTFFNANLMLYAILPFFRILFPESIVFFSTIHLFPVSAFAGACFPHTLFLTLHYADCFHLAFVAF